MIKMKEIPDYTKSRIKSYNHLIDSLGDTYDESTDKERFVKKSNELYLDVFEDRKIISELRIYSVPKPVDDMLKNIERAMNSAISFFRDYKIIKGL